MTNQPPVFLYHYRVTAHRRDGGASWVDWDQAVAVAVRSADPDEARRLAFLARGNPPAGHDWLLRLDSIVQLKEPT